MPALRQIVSRADDAGSCRGANRAILQGLRAGSITAVGFMVPAPGFEDAVATLAGELRPADAGLHATINSEWTSVRWGPVLPVERVRSLVDPDGYFRPRPTDRPEDLVTDEVLAEIAAQLTRLREAGVEPNYLDTHMGFDRFPAVSLALADFARAQGLRYVAQSPAYLPTHLLPGHTRLASWRKHLAAAPPGVYQLVTHPATDTPDLRAFWHEGLEPGQVAQERSAETAALCDPDFFPHLAAVQAQLVRFSALL